MPAATPRRIPNIVTFQHEVLRIISTLNAGSLCPCHVTMAIRCMFYIFWTKRPNFSTFNYITITLYKLVCLTMYQNFRKFDEQQVRRATAYTVSYFSVYLAARVIFFMDE